MEGAAGFFSPTLHFPMVVCQLSDIQLGTSKQGARFPISQQRQAGHAVRKFPGATEDTLPLISTAGLGEGTEIPASQERQLKRLARLCGLSQALRSFPHPTQVQQAAGQASRRE